MEINVTIDRGLDRMGQSGAAVAGSRVRGGEMNSLN
jgi:hypothetical protein